MKTLGITFACLLVNMSTMTAEQPSGASKFNDSMKPIILSYLAIQEALAADDTAPVVKEAKAIQANLEKIDIDPIKGPNQQFYRELPARLKQAIDKLAKATDLAAARKEFYEVSRPITLWASTAKPAGTRLAYSAMAAGGWLQKDGPLRNPYYGSQMIRCGEFVEFAGE